MIAEDYVSFETAKLLKEKGFREICNKCYGIESKKFFSDIRSNDDDTMYAAPTHQMAMKWLREVHEFIVTIDYDRYPVYEENDIVGYGYNIQTKDNPEDYYRISESVYNSHEDACEAAIKYCLENLI